MTLYYFRRLGAEIRIFHTTRTLVDYSFRPGETASVWAKKAARTLEIPDSGQGVPKQPSNLRNGREKPGFEAPGASFFRAREGVGSLGFRPSFAASVFLSRKLSDNTDATTERIRKTNLSLQTISINSNSRYFGEIMRSAQFRISPVRLTDCQIRSSDLSGGVENQHLCINNHSQRGLPHYTVS